LTAFLFAIMNNGQKWFMTPGKAAL
jgi:hypothetical protein